MTKVANKHPTPGREVKPQRVKSRQDQHHDELGREIPDPTPLAPPLGYKKQPTLAEQMRAMVISEKLKAEARAAGAETFEEADDFNVGDDYDPTSPYEEIFEPLPAPDERPIAQQIADAIFDKLGPAQQPSPGPAAGPGGGEQPPPGASPPPHTPPTQPPSPAEAVSAARTLFRR